MQASANNIYSDIPEQLPEELFNTLLKRDGIHIERIISKDHSTPPGQWHNQAWDEWIMLLQGQATLIYQHTAEPINLAAGDYLLIPANTRHRVEWTPANTNTIWLAVHLSQR